MYEIPKDKAFLVAVKALITNSKNELLLLKVHTGLRDSSKWDLPGGLMEFDDTVETRLNKEVLEETGLVLQDWQLLNVSETIFEKFTFGDEVKDTRVVVIGYQVKINENTTTVSVSEEHDSYAWYSREALMQIELSKPSKAIIMKVLDSLFPLF